ncbi:IS3 family transposase [Flavobacterium zhairuonense]|uniref:IS3 family transposase n=1 Tax=Flavobacterium zhairuonense TaxID=2493631 RepID=UPI001049766D|nr:IS3 family transposase [Flavobacterium zhairuonense]KAF2512846.1 IS3 family transposase [Flavobacterium zhairuonense]
MMGKIEIYNRIFKEQAVLLSYERGSAKQVAIEFEISCPLLYRWRKEYQKFGSSGFCGRGNGKLRLSIEEQKIRELKKKVKQSELRFEILKNGSKYLLQGKSMTFNFIKINEKVYTIEKMCKVLGVGTLTYYKWKNQFISETQHRITLLKKEITSIFFESKQRYGRSKILRELQNRGYKTSSSAVTRYMNQLGLRCKRNKKKKITTNSNHNNFVADNVLNRKFTVNEPSRVWVSDITYIRIKDGFLYLTIILDLFDRKIIGWKLSNSLTTEQTTIPAWKMAINNREIINELIFHSDRGLQYANRNFTKILDSNKLVTRSMSRKGNFWDNSIAESFFSRLKTEMVYRNKLLGKEQMEIEIFEFIENWYNKERIHSALNFKTIEEFGKMKNIT